jgi:glyoxylase I family protein
MRILGLHHFAYRCRDAEETRHFYEDLLGLPLVHLIREDHVPSTGEYCPYVHIFFQMYDGSCVAFFDLGDDKASDPSPNTPAWVNHLALKMDSLQEVEAAKARLEKSGIEVLGITDHKIIKSIYFFDPNGIRLEACCEPQKGDKPGVIDSVRQTRAEAREELESIDRGWAEATIKAGGFT